MHRLQGKAKAEEREEESCNVKVTTKWCRADASSLRLPRASKGTVWQQILIPDPSKGL